MVRRPSQKSGGSSRPCQRSGSGLEALSKVREWSVSPPKGLKVVGRPYRRAGSVWEALPGTVLDDRSSLRAGSGRENLPKIWEALPKGRSGQEALPKGLEWSGSTPEGPIVFKRPFQRLGSGREALLEVR